MNVSIENEDLEKKIKLRKKYNLGSDVDKDIVFDFHYLLHEDTVSYIKKHGKVMFILRGPPSTGKATLSEMLTSTYPDAEFCCADSYFKNSFTAPVRNKVTLAASHEYCEKKARDACGNDAKTIIIQNTHIRKWEMQPYLNLAAQFHYTIIMAITLYRFNVTPEALLANNTDGLDINYFRNRMRQWADLAPVLTGWFLSPQDSSFVLASLLESLKDLTGDGKFCRVFDIYDHENAIKHFRAKKLLYCLAGYARNHIEMKNHYLSDMVQYFYGKCFSITIIGYHINKSEVCAIVQVNKEMQHLIFNSEKKLSDNYDIADEMAHLEVNPNLYHYSKTTPFKEGATPTENTSVLKEDWLEDENFNVSKSSFIQLAVKEDDIFKIGNTRKELESLLKSLSNEEGVIDSSKFNELENGTMALRLDDDSWLVKETKKIVVKTVYTGLYV